MRKPELAAAIAEKADLKVLCRDAEGKLLGYALTGTAVMEKLALNKELPPLLA